MLKWCFFKGVRDLRKEYQFLLLTAMQHHFLGHKIFACSPGRGFSCWAFLHAPRGYGFPPSRGTWSNSWPDPLAGNVWEAAGRHFSLSLMLLLFFGMSLFHANIQMWYDLVQYWRMLGRSFKGSFWFCSPLNNLMLSVILVKKKKKALAVWITCLCRRTSRH